MRQSNITRTAAVGFRSSIRSPDDERDEYEDLSSTFGKVCRVADERQRRKRVDPSITRARRLLDDSITLAGAWSELGHPWIAEGRAAASTVEALMLGLRERGTAALKEPKVRARLAQLSERQLCEVGDRLQLLKREIARAWTPAEVGVLVDLWRKLHVV
jgi:hypothetical protein